MATQKSYYQTSFSKKFFIGNVLIKTIFLRHFPIFGTSVHEKEYFIPCQFNKQLIINKLIFWHKNRNIPTNKQYS